MINTIPKLLINYNYFHHLPDGFVVIYGGSSMNVAYLSMRSA